MSSNTRVSKWMTIIAVALFGSFLGMIRDARAAVPTTNQNGPVIKNLMALTYRAPAARAATPQQLTKRDVKKLTATAESSEDHLKLARYYKAAADRLDAQATGYEQAAAAYRHGPIVKNLMAPNTPARYEYLAKGFRAEAKSDRGVAASHEQMAKNAVASL